MLTKMEENETSNHKVNLWKAVGKMDYFCNFSSSLEAITLKRLYIRIHQCVVGRKGSKELTKCHRDSTYECKVLVKVKVCRGITLLSSAGKILTVILSHDSIIMNAILVKSQCDSSQNMLNRHNFPVRIKNTSAVDSACARLI